MNAVAVLSDGRTLVSAGGDYWGGELHDSSARVWDLDTGDLRRTFKNHADAVECIAVNGPLAASGDFQGNIILWEVATGKELRRCAGDGESAGGAERPLHALAFSSDGSRLLSGSGLLSGSVELWDAHSGRRLRRFPRQFGATHAVAFSPDGALAVSGHGHYGPGPTDILGTRTARVVDGVFRIWNVASGEELRRVGAPPEQSR